MYTSLDKITRSVLLQKSLPIHFYVQLLQLAADAVRELSFDAAKIVNTVELVVDTQSYTAALPCDFVDWTKVGIPVGQIVRPIYEVDSINRLQAKTTTGQPTTYTQGRNNDDTNLPPAWPGYWLYANINDLGENIGRQFGVPAANTTNGFKIIRERNQIQFTETFNQPTCIMEYISNGACVDNISKVDPLAQAVIEAYMDWKFKLNVGRRSLGEIALAFDQFKRQMRIYRARKSDLTITAIKQAIFSNYKLSIKT